MSDPRLLKLAHLLVYYSIRVQPGDQVALRCLGSIAPSLHLHHELMREVLKAGAHPCFIASIPAIEEFDHTFFSEASEQQLAHIDPFREVFSSRFDGIITVLSEVNTRRLTHVDPARVATYARAHSHLVKLFLERAAKGELRWVMTAMPTPGYALDAEMSLEEYEDFIYSATFVDTPDPVAAWEDISRKQKRLVDWLAGKKSLRVRGPHADLEFSIAGRDFINCDGRANMPDGEIFTGPVEDSVEGWIESTFPALYGGVDVGRVTLRLEKGIIVQAEAEKNPAHLTQTLDTDEGARRLGEFGIGTNRGIQAFTKNMLFDEKIAGTIHIAAGASMPETGATNESGIHWDFLCDMRQGGRIAVDGQPFYDSGEFLV